MELLSSYFKLYKNNQQDVTV